MWEFEDAPFRPGDLILDRYEVKALLGRGGHAFVFHCRDLVLEQDVAVKVIPNPPDKGRDLLERALKEARFLYRFNHPNVVCVLGAELIAGRMVCIVMELLDGVSLRQLLAVLGPLGIIEALSITRQLAAGAAAAHSKDVIHRDIKPDNVLVRPPRNQVKLLDFGIAKFLAYGVETGDRTRFHGTPIYMSPEHLKGETVTPLSDMYQIGTVAFEMLAGLPPVLVGVAEANFSQVAHAQIARETPLLRDIVAGIPPQLDYLIQTATAKDPQHRFPSMGKFLEAIDRELERCLATLPVHATHIRYVDENVMRLAKALVGSFGSELLRKRPLTGPTPVPLIEVPARPFEVWDTDMVSNPGFGLVTPAPAPERDDSREPSPTEFEQRPSSVQPVASVSRPVASDIAPPQYAAPRAAAPIQLFIQPSASVEVFAAGTSTAGTPPSVSHTVPEAERSTAASSADEGVPSWMALLLASATLGAVLATGILLAPKLGLFAPAGNQAPGTAMELSTSVPFAEVVPALSAHPARGPETPPPEVVTAGEQRAELESASSTPAGGPEATPQITAVQSVPTRPARKRVKKATAPASSSAPMSASDRIRENARKFREEREREKRQPLWIGPE